MKTVLSEIKALETHLKTAEAPVVYAFKHGDIEFRLTGSSDKEASVTPRTMHEVLDALDRILKIKLKR